MRKRRGGSRRKRPAAVEQEEEGEEREVSSSGEEPMRKRRPVVVTSQGTEKNSAAKSSSEDDDDDDNDETASQTTNDEGWERDTSPGIRANEITQCMFNDDTGLISPMEDFDEEDDTDTDVEGDDGDDDNERTKRREEVVEEPRRSTRGSNKRPRQKQNDVGSSSGDSTAMEDDEEEVAKKRGRNKKRSKSKKKMPRCYSPVWSCLTAKEEEKSDGLGLTKSGTIKSLRLYNFMCHESFYQEWHPNINFIIGENGSGKSALLSGMLIGLGAKATATSRSRSTTDLIMKGKDCARTQLVLMNKGHLSVTKYGREFMLERTISKTGSSTYRIKAEGHNWRPLKRNELDYILMVLNIQLDNPVAILNQEVAKNFLRTKDPKDKYELFYMGTLLERLFGLLAASRVDIDAAAKNLEIHKKIIDELRSSIKSLRKKLEEFENLRKLSSKIVSLEAEYLWALVTDEESKQKTLEEKLTEIDNKKVQFVAKIADMKSKMQETVDDKGLAEQVKALKSELEEKEKLKDSIRKDKNAKAVLQNSLKGQIRSMQVEMSNKKGEISIVEKTLSHVLSVSEEDEERFMREYEAKKMELQDKKTQIVQTMNTLRNDGDQFKNGADSVGEKLINLENEHASLLKEIEMKKRLINNMDGSDRNKYTVYGQPMEDLVKKIELNASKFKKLPRGPIGSYITVTNPKYTKLVEDVLMNTRELPCSFIVDNSSDLRILDRLVNETYRNVSKYRPTILTNPFLASAHDIRNGKARIDGIPTLWDMIEIEKNDPVIINALLDYAGVERILMFESNDAAAAVMKDVSKVPPTCSSAFTLEWFKFTPMPNYAATAKKKLQSMNIIHSSKKDQRETLQRVIDQLKTQLETIRPNVDATKKEKATLLKQAGERKTEYEKKKRELAQIEKEILQNENNKYQAPDVASHREELQSLQDALAELEEKKEEVSQRLDELQTQIQAFVEQMRQVEADIPKIQTKMAKIDSEKDNNSQKIEKLRQLVLQFEGKIKNVETQRGPIQTELDNCQAELNRKLEQATTDTQQRVVTTRSSGDVKKDFEHIKRQRKEMEKQLGNQREMQKDFDKFNQEFMEKCKEYDPLYNSFVILRDLVESQLVFLFKKRAEISNGLTVTYTALARQRGYKGQMLIDHDKKELHFFICPDKSSSSKTDLAVRDAGKQSQKSLIEYSLGLSGGERSFSTICFILSLWQIMECPFYMLDEFDVYMDALNRKASQNALITHAKAFRSNQFFLYTPLELCEVPDKKDALTLRLRPARPTENGVPQPPSPVTDNETENVNPQARSGASKRNKGGKGRNAPAMSEKNRVSAEN